jgi:hypothetical protein
MTTTYNHEAVELALYIDNDRATYDLLSQYTATLDKHWQRGRFSKERALVLLERYVQQAAKNYHAEHGTPGDKWYHLFDPATRRTVAESLLDEYIDQMIGA